MPVSEERKEELKQELQELVEKLSKTAKYEHLPIMKADKAALWQKGLSDIDKMKRNAELDGDTQKAKEISKEKSDIVDFVCFIRTVSLRYFRKDSERVKEEDFSTASTLSSCYEQFINAMSIYTLVSYLNRLHQELNELIDLKNIDEELKEKDEFSELSQFSTVFEILKALDAVDAFIKYQDNDLEWDTIYINSISGLKEEQYKKQVEQHVEQHKKKEEKFLRIKKDFSYLESIFRPYLEARKYLVLAYSNGNEAIDREAEYKNPNLKQFQTVFYYEPEKARKFSKYEESEEEEDSILINLKKLQEDEKGLDCILESQEDKFLEKLKKSEKEETKKEEKESKKEEEEETKETKKVSVSEEYDEEDKTSTTKKYPLESSTVPASVNVKSQEEISKEKLHTLRKKIMKTDFNVRVGWTLIAKFGKKETGEVETCTNKVPASAKEIFDIIYQADKDKDAKEGGEKVYQLALPKVVDILIERASEQKQQSSNILGRLRYGVFVGRDSKTNDFYHDALNDLDKKAEQDIDSKESEALTL